MAKLTDKQLEFLDNPYPGVVTTVRDDGTLHSTIVWVEREGSDVSFNTALGRAKPRHLQHNPNVSLVVVDPNDSYKWVAVDGTAELTTDGADAQIDRLAKKYMGADEYPYRNPDEQRVTVRIRPLHVDSSGLDE